jgi:hypothetical protein
MPSDFLSLMPQYYTQYYNAVSGKKNGLAFLSLASSPIPQNFSPPQARAKFQRRLISQLSSFPKHIQVSSQYLLPILLWVGNLGEV